LAPTDNSTRDRIPLQAFLTCTLLVALAEVGDKTQLLSFVLAACLRKPWAILGGILTATLLNHALAGWAGTLLVHAVPARVLAWIVGLSFIGFGVWALKPDSPGDAPRIHRAGAFATSFVAFFLAEMGDKTQLATVALAARFEALVPVVIGTTLGMMIANIPAVWVGDRLAQKIPMRAVRTLTAVLFVGVGILLMASTLATDG
jgi:putative Ca2+/H+ antiporter (TMEM165/GDT1 family)